MDAERDDGTEHRERPDRDGIKQCVECGSICRDPQDYRAGYYSRALYHIICSASKCDLVVCDQCYPAHTTFHCWLSH